MAELTRDGARGGGAVEEIPGLYGPFTFPEKVLQRIWHERAFDVPLARLVDGRKVTIRYAGRWNQLGGPDFKGARLVLGEDEVEGDVELHLRAEDWVAHGHAMDPAYDCVVLHVVLFPTGRPMTAGRGGREIPTLALLPLLWHDLEEYAAEEAVAVLANRPARRWVVELGHLPEEEINARLDQEARRRWRQKVRYAEQRIAKLGWVGACHHAALEILGYRFNRAPMLRVAGAWPVERWREADATLLAEAWAVGEPWSLQGVRPANAPRLRLQQYAAWNQARPGWVTGLAVVARQCAAGGQAAAGDIAAARQRVKLAQWRGEWRTVLTGDEVGGARFDHLLGDGWLPLLVAAGQLDEAAGWVWWRIGYPGDLPDYLGQGLKELGVAGVPGRPKAMGPAQGLLGWLLAQESRQGEATVGEGLDKN